MNTKIKNEIIRRDFDKYFTIWNNEKGARKGFHASSLLAPEKGTKAYCHREHVLGAYYVREPSIHNPATLRVFANGWKLHCKWQEIFEIAGVALYNETEHFIDIEELQAQFIADRKFKEHMTEDGRLVRISASGLKKLPLSFTPDSLILYNDVPTVIEIKGYRTETYTAIAKDPYKTYQYRDARIQANLYMYLLGVTQSIILIENKNDQEFLTIEETYDHDLIVPYAQRASNLVKLVNMYEGEKKLVKGICDNIDCTRAKACPMRNVCFCSAEEREGYRLNGNI